jgi:uncharacterized spore protein YtfJ
MAGVAKADTKADPILFPRKKERKIMANEPINDKLKTLFSNMEDYISTKTVVGEPYKIGDVILVPLVDVCFGMGAGLGARTNEADKEGEAGGGAMGAKLSPAAVIVIVNGTVQLVNVKNHDSVNKLIDMIPGVLSKFNLDSLFNKSKKTEAEEEL